MRETLFLIPHFLFTGPLLWGWLVVMGGLLGYFGWVRGDRQRVWELLPLAVIGALVIWFGLPLLEVPGINPEDPTGPRIPLGIAIRGYGLFLLLGMVAGIGVVLGRAGRFGMTTDQVLTLTFTMVVCGIVGARLFYVIQKWDSFRDATGWELIRETVDMTKGGLVVYGSLIGGLVGAIAYLWKSRLPVRLTADLLAPGMAIGLALGRIGCLMNGCCFGGVCESDLPRIEFPVGAPPYMAQLEQGTLLGMTLQAPQEPGMGYRVIAVEPGSMADELGVNGGDEVGLELPDRALLVAALKEGLPVETEVVLVHRPAETGSPRAYPIPARKLPLKSRPVHPTQIYSAINAFLLALVLWFYFPFRRSDGEVFALLLVLYSIARFLLESIRSDEMGQFGTDWTISQWISMVALGVGLLAWIALRLAPRHRTEVVC